MRRGPALDLNSDIWWHSRDPRCDPLRPIEHAGPEVCLVEGIQPASGGQDISRYRHISDLPLIRATRPNRCQVLGTSMPRLTARSCPSRRPSLPGTLPEAFHRQAVDQVVEPRLAEVAAKRQRGSVPDGLQERFEADEPGPVPLVEAEAHAGGVGPADQPIVVPAQRVRSERELAGVEVRTRAIELQPDYGEGVVRLPRVERRAQGDRVDVLLRAPALEARLRLLQALRAPNRTGRSGGW